MRGRAALAAVVLCGGVGVGVAAGCGSSSSDQHDASVASQAVQQALAKQRTEVERLLGPVAKKAMGSSTGSFESQLDAAHETKEEDDG